MVRVLRLPPPPAVPKTSPPVDVAGEVATRIAALRDGGPALEARAHVPAAAVRAVVICHPHPLYGGSMHSPVPLAVAKRLSEAASGRVAWVRFNFRGVGASEGAYDDGRGEVDDARAVIAYVRNAAPGARVALCGHSFGSWVGLRAAAAEGGAVDRALLIAPSTRFFDFGVGVPGESRFGGAVTVFVGGDDELCDVAEARALAVALGADLRVFEGFDHHFMKSRRALAEAALPVLVPEAA